MIGPLTIRQVLRRLAPDVRLTPETETAVRAALQSLDAGTPWYLRVLMAFGAWIGTWFLLGFVLGILAIPFGGRIEGTAMLIGLSLIGGGVALRRMSPNDFVNQLALVLSLTGQGLFIGGVGATTGSPGAAAALTLILSATLIGLFPDRLHRFLSTVAAAIAVLALTYEMRLPYAGEVVALGLIAGALGLWRGAPADWRQSNTDIVEPVATGLVVSLLGLLLTGAILDFAEVHEASWLGLRALTTIGAVLGLLWLVHEIADDHRPGAFGAEALALSAAIVVLAALTWRTPGIATTLLIVVLAFDRRSRILLGLAILFFLAFATLYYYNLEFTLLQKSGVLVGSGVLCLAGCAAVRWRSGEEAAA